MDHLQRVRQEFARQSGPFAASASIANDTLTRRFVDAIGCDASCCVLDVACGPGIISAALAPQVREVTAFDLTPEMLAMARQRCAQAGLDNVRFQEGSATSLPFAPGQFDVVVTRLSIHHFAEPDRALAEMHRVLRAGGTLVVADVVSSADPDESALQNAIEVLRDPSHVRMLPAAALAGMISAAGFAITAETTWDVKREFDEWARIVDDADRIAPLRTIVRALARSGQHAGMRLSLSGSAIVFFHRWHMAVARKAA